MRAGVPTANVYPADDSPESLDSGSDERGSIWYAMVGLSAHAQLAFSISTIGVLRTSRIAG